MPSTTFLNLSDEKQEAFISAAKKAFSEHLLPDVKISQIVQEANIARGSFYAYFDSKEELYGYLLSKYQNSLTELLKELLSKENGDLIPAFLSLYDNVVKTLEDDKERAFLTNVLFNMNLYREYQLAMKRQEPLKNIMWHQVSVLVDKSKYNDNAKELLNEIFFMLLSMLAHEIMPTLIKKQDIKDSREHYAKCINLIAQGIY